jgi:predicted nuclease of restriction endonuclease-like (RecB) superfamily
LPGGHVTVLLNRLDDGELREWYAARAVADGWSRGVLEDRTKGRLHARIGAAPSNFPNRLAPADSDLAQQSTRDPVLLDFLGLRGPVQEQAVEDAVIDDLTRTMLELFDGLAFLGSQVPLRVGDHEFTADLIFLQYQPAVRFIVVESKVGRFDPREAGQLSFYVQAVERRFRNPNLHAATIGILLCTSRDDQVVEYSLASTADSGPIAPTLTSRPAASQERVAAIRFVRPGLSGAVSHPPSPDRAVKTSNVRHAGTFQMTDTVWS